MARSTRASSATRRLAGVPMADRPSAARLVEIRDHLASRGYTREAKAVARDLLVEIDALKAEKLVVEIKLANLIDGVRAEMVRLERTRLSR